MTLIKTQLCITSYPVIIIFFLFQKSWKSKYWKITKPNPAQLSQLPSTVAGLRLLSSPFLPGLHNYCDSSMISVHYKHTSSCMGRTKANPSKEEGRVKLVEK